MRKFLGIFFFLLIAAGGYFFYQHYLLGKVSVIIPAYNVEKYIDECMQSVLGQTYKNLEVVAVDDASTDGTLKKLEEYAAKDPRVKLLRHETNQGAAAARETAFAATTGKYVLFVDSDDYISHDYIYQMVHAIHKYKTPFVLNNSVYLKNDKNGKKGYLWWTVLPRMGKVEISKKCMWFQWALWGKIFERDFLVKSDFHFPHLRHNTDLFSHALFLGHSRQFAAIHGGEYIHRHRQNSLQTEKSGDARFRNSFLAHKAIWEYAQANNLEGALRPNLAQFEQEILMLPEKPELLYPEMRKFLQQIQPDIEARSEDYFPEELEFLHRATEAADYATYRQNHPVEHIGYWSWYQAHCLSNFTH